MIREYYQIQDDGEITRGELTGDLHWSLYACGVCDGSGEVDPDSDRLCSECKGTGEDSSGEGCEACEVTGINFDGPWADEFIEDTGDDEPT